MTKKAASKKSKFGNRGIFAVVAVVIVVGVTAVCVTSANTWDAAERDKLAMLETAAAPEPTEVETVVAANIASTQMPDPTPTPIASLVYFKEAEGAEVDEETLQSLVYRDVAYGEEDPVVSKIQTRLMELNYMEVDEPTRKLGPITSQALEYFQRKNGLDITGAAEIATQKALFSEEARVYTVSEGASGLDVEQIQERLAELGYAASVTGYYGSETVAAVTSFQQRNELTDDGTVGKNTKEVLFSSDAVPAKKKADTDKKDNTDKKPSEEEEKKKDDSDKEEKKEEQKEEKPTDTGDEKTEEGKDDDGGGGSVSPADPGSVSAFIDAAYAQLGKPYVLGGKGPDVFDCSGFVYYALNQSGYSIGYMTSGGWASSGFPSVGSMNDLQRGDVVCFNGHVGIYLGDGEMIDASSSQGQIRVCSSIQSNSYWVSNFICGKRPL